MTVRDAQSRGRRYSGMSSTERIDQRRQMLLDSALELFGTSGYSVASIKQICRGAELTERYFYESFAGRETCLQVLYDGLATAMRAETATAVDAAGSDLHEAMTAGLSAFIGYLTDDPRRARVVLVEVVGVSAEMERRRHRVLQGFVELIMTVWSAHSERRFERRDRLIATALVGGVNHLLVDWIMNGRSDEPIDLIAACVEMFDVIQNRRDS